MIDGCVVGIIHGHAHIVGMMGSTVCGRLLLRLLQVPVIDALVIAQAVQRAVNTFADIADGLFSRSHVHILNVSLETRQRR